MALAVEMVEEERGDSEDCRCGHNFCSDDAKIYYCISKRSCKL